jgi:diguanylate cyclase (GGDEF)-like protein
VQTAQRDRASALWTLRLALGSTVLLVVLTLLLTALMARLVVRPLRRLRDHAQRVSTGALGDLPVLPAGPRELREVETTFAEVVANVRTVEAQVAALAGGEPDDAVLRQPVPGRLGALLHDSVERLSRSMAEREEMAAALAYEARHDALTGLPNRTAAAEELTRALARAQRGGHPVAVLYIDLDGFKHVNDNLGHNAGDAVLGGTAARLAACIRTGDFAARIGGDEFLVITEQAASPEEVVELGNRVVAELSEPLTIGVGVTRVGASVGVAIARDGETDGERLLGDADVAAYQAKASGRGRVEVFGEELRIELARHTEIDNALREALDRDELELFFQPVVDPVGHVGGAEALLRWHRPGHGLVPPGDFIPVAEASDLIIDIGRWVLDRACGQLAIWAQDPALDHLTMAVNLSGRHLLNLTVVDDVQSALTRHGVAPERLTVEITETTMLTDVPLVHEHLDSLRRLGVRVAIDDFGTGYTSLAHLRSLPVDVLKIDRSMIMNSDKQPDAHVLSLLVETAHALGLRLVAEGVETPQQFSHVRDLGCQSIQGFLFSRPVPADEFRAYITANSSALVSASVG